MNSTAPSESTETVEYVPLMVEAGRAFPGRTITIAIQCGHHLAATFEDRTSACTCGAVWSQPSIDLAIRQRALEFHVER